MGPRDATALLKAHAGGTCYLTRYYWGDYKLSVKTSLRDEVQHFKLKCESIEGQSRFSVKQAEVAKEFTNVPELLEYYKFNRINSDVSSIGDCLEPEISYVYTAPTVQNEITYPTRANLFMLKWTDAEGKVQRLRIFQELSKKWEDIGILLGLSWSELEEVKSSGCGDDVRCCQLVFKEYLSGKYTQHYPKTWDGLYELMQDVEFEELADKLKEILASKHIFV